MKAVLKQAVSCCVCDKPKINYAAHACQLSVHVCLLGRLVANLILLESSMDCVLVCLSRYPPTCCLPPSNSSEQCRWVFLVLSIDHSSSDRSSRQSAPTSRRPPQAWWWTISCMTWKWFNIIIFDPARSTWVDRKHSNLHSIVRLQKAWLWCLLGSVTRFGDLLDFGQLFKAFGNN